MWNQNNMSKQSSHDKRVEMENHLRELDVNEEINDMAMQRMGGLLFKRYEFLQESGFNKEQAFELIKHRGLL